MVGTVTHLGHYFVAPGASAPQDADAWFILEVRSSVDQQGDKTVWSRQGRIWRVLTARWKEERRWGLVPPTSISLMLVSLSKRHWSCCLWHRAAGCVGTLSCRTPTQYAHGAAASSSHATRPGWSGT